MKIHVQNSCLFRLWFLLGILISSTLMAREPLLLFDARSEKGVEALPSGGQFEFTGDENEKWLSIQTKGNRSAETWPGVMIRGNWDLTGFDTLRIELKDGSRGALPLTVRLENADADRKAHKNLFVAFRQFLPPARTVAEFPIPPQRCQLPSTPEKVVGLRISPWSDYAKFSDLDPSCVTAICLYVERPMLDWAWSVRRITACCSAGAANSVPAWRKLPPEKIYPFVDAYGQFRFEDWKEKTHSDADLEKFRQKEALDLTAHPGPKNWNRYGGWLSGPHFPAKGQFYAVLLNENGQIVPGSDAGKVPEGPMPEGWKWWLVDPDGCLFWSNGPVRVTNGGGITPLDGREKFFEWLPSRDSEFGFCYDVTDSLHDYYVARKIQKTFDFMSANLLRKYGPNWKSTYAELAHQRLRSWGMNSLANGTEAYVCDLRKTPYVDRVEVLSEPIQGSQGMWWPFRDPFDPSFRACLERELAARQSQLADPWCFGFFVDNELTWGGPDSLAQWTLRSPKEQCAKQEFVRFLQQKYPTLEALNAAWKTDFASWDAFLECQTAVGNCPNEDAIAFSAHVTDAYFRTVRETFKKIAPQKLYLGCRFAGSTPSVVRIAAKYCDVLSFNLYRKSLKDFQLPEGVNRPILVGEYHFGVKDRGLVYPGLVPAENQKQRAEMLETYLRSALNHPNFVGVHWFQWADMPLTGRFDGANAQIGLVDLCDTPYEELIESFRRIGEQLYEIRAER